MTNFGAVLDVSAVVWDPTDFENNTSSYFKLKDELITFIEKVTEERPPLLLRSGLLNEMINGFPFNLMPNSFNEFGRIVYSFLVDMGSSIIEFELTENSSVTYRPPIIKQHFNDTIVREMNYLASEMHSNTTRENVYFTFTYLWHDDDRLQTVDETSGSKVHKTVVADKNGQLNAFFASQKKIFEANPKHHPGKESGDYEAPLSCIKGNDLSIAQKYLEEAIPLGKKHFAFDKDNGVFIVFFRHLGNLYHGHDEHNINKIPSVIRKKFNK